MSGQQLKDLFEAGLAAAAPDTVDVDAAIAAGRRRRRVRVGGTLLASAAVVVVAVLLGTGLFPSRGPDTTGPADGTSLQIPTSQWKDGDAGMTALAQGVLVLRTDGCLVLASDSPEMVVVWPAGFTAVARDGGAEVLGADGSVVARSGEQISLGGGESNVGVSGPCLGGPTPIFTVNDAPPYDRNVATATPATWTPVRSVDDLNGTWLPTVLDGVDVAGAVDLRGAQLVLVVRGSGLSARDGLCNYVEEGVQVEDGGRVVLASQSMTAVGCDRQRPGWPAAGVAAYDARSAHVRAAGGDQPRQLRLLAEDGKLLGEYVEVAPSTWNDSAAGALCLDALAKAPGLVDVTHARPTTVEAVRERTVGPSDTSPAAKPWADLDGAATAAWCTSRAGSTWSVTAVTADAPPVMFMSAGTPLGDPGTDGPPIP